ncbi:MAG: type II toxin-antitoxin system HicB family antitoxin [Bacteriovorax sp.]|nr:type II toxin-antitoxin system HicB family antitoxin [Bacteriovorax sp.]
MKTKKKSPFLIYKDYKASIEFDAELGFFHGEVQGLNDIITFQGKSVNELKTEMKKSVEEYLLFCKKKSKSPAKSFSGNLNLRMDPTLHEKINLEAKKFKMSLNEFINLALMERTKDL